MPRQMPTNGKPPPGTQTQQTTTVRYMAGLGFVFPYSPTSTDYTYSPPTLRASSHTRLKAHDHFNSRALIGRKGGDPPSSLHTWRWRPKGPKKTSRMKSLHGVLHGRLWIRFHGLSEFTSGLPPRGGVDTSSKAEKHTKEMISAMEEKLLGERGAVRSSGAKEPWRGIDREPAANGEDTWREELEAQLH